MNEEQGQEDIGLYVRPYETGPVRRLAPKMSRNSQCPFDNIKFKKCCGAKGLNFCQKMLNNFFEKAKEAPSTK